MRDRTSYAFAVVSVAVTVTLSILWIRPANAAAREWDSKMSGMIADSITGNQTVKSFAAETREDRLFADVAANWHARRRNDMIFRIEVRINQC